MKINPNSLAEQRRALEMLRADWQRQAERAELAHGTSAETPSPSGGSVARAAAAMVADLDERARAYMPTHQATQREVERDTLAARVQTALDMENFGDASAFSHAWWRRDTVQLRAEHAVRRARYRLRTEAWRAWRAAGCPPGLDDFITSYMGQHAGIQR